MFEYLTQYPYWTTAGVSFLVNIPCGFIRERYQKFSIPWLIWIHASIPVLVYLRTMLDVSKLFVPITIVCAIAGQILGSKYRLKRRSEQQWREYERIPELNDKNENIEQVKDEDVLVALLNMGGPRTNADVNDFQKRLFSDSLLIRFPLSKIFQSLFANILIFFRGEEAKRRYNLIGGGSEIFVSTERQAKALQTELKRRGRNIHVTFSFNYSPPLPQETIAQAKNMQKTCLLPLSLYPHYSSATTGSNIHYLKKEAASSCPSLRFLKSPSYFLHDSYIDGFVDRINEQVRSEESLDDFYLIFSAHGLPLYFLEEGDPYPFQIAQTVGAIIKKLNRQDSWVISYQSAVGPLQWLKPSTDAILTAAAKDGIKKVLVVPVSFVTDHIETLCEIDIEYRKFAQDRGITDFRMSRALECHPGFVQALADSVELALPRKKIKTVLSQASSTAL